ncbi:MAG: hypothetical protein ABI180_15285 [Microcoleus sp.]
MRQFLILYKFLKVAVTRTGHGNAHWCQLYLIRGNSFLISGTKPLIGCIAISVFFREFCCLRRSRSESRVQIPLVRSQKPA